MIGIGVSKVMQKSVRSLLSGAYVYLLLLPLIVVTCGQKVSGYSRVVVAVWSLELGT